jgi:sugar transferase (PEP-CTERM system associated)
VSSVRIFNHYVRTQFVILGVIEGVVLFLCVYAASYLRFWGESIPYNKLWLQSMVYTFIMILAMIATGLYQARLREGGLGFGLRLLTSYLLGTSGVAVIIYIFPNLYLGRGVLIYTSIISLILITCIRFVVYILSPDIYKRRIMVLGTGKSANVLTELRRKSDQFGFVILGYVHFRGEKDIVPQDRILKINSTLARYVSDNDVDEIVLAIDDRRKGIPMQELLDCKMRGIDVVDVVSFFERETGKIRVDQLQPSWLLFSQGFRQSVMRDGVKRIFDLSASSFILALTWPLMLLTIIAVWIEGGFKFDTPMLYRQVRVGLDGRPFQVNKFRSMVVNAEKQGQAQWAKKNDSRITRVGRIIRKTRIDELPQIYNVFRGDMSFVGPRPERPEFVVMLAEKIPYYSERHRVKPGITGWAQLLYPYGSTENDAVEKLQYDLYYIKNHSIFLDFLILLQTAEVVIFGRGAR